MIIKSFIAAFLIFFVLYYTLKNKAITIPFFETGKATKFITLLGILFLIFFYLIPVSYYFPYNNGVLGDNYVHLERALNQPGFIKHHHPLFPLISEKFLSVLISIKLLSINDPMFLEQAFYWSVFPISLGLSLSLILFSFILFKKNLSNLIWACILVLMATSYGVWLWAIQSNAIGLAIATELVVVSLFMIWYKSKKLGWLSLLAFFVGLSVFVHNGLIYLAMGSFLSVIWVLFRDRANNKRVLVQVVFFSVILFIMAAFYYLLQAKINNTYNLVQLFHTLSDSNYFGSFGSGEILGAMEGNFWAGINWLIGFYYTSAPSIWSTENVKISIPFAGEWFKAIQTGAVFTLLMVISIDSFKRRLHPSKDLLIFGLINSVVFFAGFTMRQAGSHYYVLALIPNLILLIAFIIGKKEKKSNLIYVIPIVIIIAGNVYFNSFTELSIFKGRNIDDHPYYKINASILKITEGKDAAYFGKMDLHYYPNMELVAYYKTKFSTITWVTEWSDEEDLEKRIAKNQLKGEEIFVSKEAYEILDREKTESRKVADNLYLIKDKSIHKFPEP